MNHIEIKRFLSEFETKRERTIVIVDYGNVEKWKNNLKWDVGIRQLANLVRSFSFGNQFLRRFYYGADYGKNEKEIICEECKLLKAPLGPALLVAREDYKRIKKLKLTYKEMAKMEKGEMAGRHFTYDTWCEDRFISWL